MNRVSFCEIKPFVRYSRVLERDKYFHANDVIGYDARLFYCTEGRGKIIIEDKEYEVKSGMLLLWKSGVRYRYAAEENKGLKFLALNFDFFYGNSKLSYPIPPEKAELFDSEKATEHFVFSDCIAMNEPVIAEDCDMLYPKLAEINREYSEKKAFYQVRMTGLLTSVLGEIAVWKAVRDTGGHKTVSSVIQYMKDNLKNEISNEELGRVFKYHPNYINQLFVKFTGKSLHKYFQDLRFSKAIELLQKTNLSVGEICVQCGFSDLPHFSKAFKKKTGYPPSSFRLL